MDNQAATGGCHCGRVRFALAAAPTQLKRCNCSICTKLGTLMAYCPPEDFRITAGADAMGRYVWGDELIAFRFCATCACMVHWEAVAGKDVFGDEPPRIGFNARLVDGLDVGALPVVEWDGRSA